MSPPLPRSVRAVCGLLLAAALAGVVGCGDPSAPVHHTAPLPPGRIPKGR